MLRASVQAYPSEKMRRSAWQLADGKGFAGSLHRHQAVQQADRVLVRCSFALE